VNFIVVMIAAHVMSMVTAEGDTSTIAFHVPGYILVTGTVMHCAVLRITLVTKVFAIFPPQPNLVGETLVWLNVPVRRMMESVVWVVMTVRVVITSYKKFAVKVP